MLERLNVRGLGIIEGVELEFTGGFSALTGETGAGKSLLVESLKLLSGQRSQSEMVRTGDAKLWVEGRFRLPAANPLDAVLEELGVTADGELVVRREVSEAGRSRCWLNDVGVTVNALQRIAPFLLAIHGQHEQHGLSDATIQRALVDRYAGHDHLVARVRDAFGRWQKADTEVKRLRSASARRRDRLDAVAFQLAEIESVDPKPDEDEDLLKRRLLLRHAARLHDASSSVLRRLLDEEGSAVDGLAQAERGLDTIAECGLDVEGARERLAEARVHAEEVAREVRQLIADVDQDPNALEAVESRLHQLDQLMLKYGSPVAKVLEHRLTLLADRDELAGVEDRLGTAEEAAKAALEDYDLVSAELDVARCEAGRSFAEAIVEVLEDLAMEGTTLDFRWQPRTEDGSPLTRDGVAVAFDHEGVEQCELLIAANPGEEPRPMSRIASGGELSRLHLALRTVLLGRREAAGLTLLFDEVDSGLGGTTASALAGLLAGLAAEHQVLVVTHLPQVAARAERQYLIEKVLSNGRAVTSTSALDAEARELELARMLSGGELTESARSHARTLMEEK